MIGVVIPAWIQNQKLWDSTVEAVKSIDSNEPIRVVVVTTRLHHGTPQDLQAALAAVADSYVEPLVDHRDFVDLSVAGAWTRGLRLLLGLEDFSEYAATRWLSNAWKYGKPRFTKPDIFGWMANDVRAGGGTIKALAQFGRMNPEIWAWSGAAGPAEVNHEGCDFSLFMTRLETIRKVGWPDHNFRPAYYEDNDYHARIVQAGGTCRVVAAGQFQHLGSLTVNSDAEAAHHVKHWWKHNQDRFAAKWGRLPANSESEMRSTYFKTPFNRPGAAVWEFEDTPPVPV